MQGEGSVTWQATCAGLQKALNEYLSFSNGLHIAALADNCARDELATTRDHDDPGAMVVEGQFSAFGELLPDRLK